MPLDTRVNCLRTTILTILRHRSQLISLLGSCSSAMAMLRLKYCVIRIRTICDNISSTSTSYRWHQHRASVPIIATLWIKTCQHFIIPIKINTTWNLRRPGLPYRHSCQSSGLGDTRSCHHSVRFWHIKSALYSLISVKVEASKRDWGRTTVKRSRCAWIRGDHLVDAIARVVIHFPYFKPNVEETTNKISQARQEIQCDETDMCQRHWW